MIASILRTRTASLVLVSLGIVWVADSAAAHHSAAAYDQDEMVELKGVVTQWNFSMPHSWLAIVVEQPGGEPVEWRFEGGGADTANVMGGYTKDAIKPGDEVTVTASPMRNGRPFGLLRAVTFEDGRVLGPPRPYRRREGETSERPGAGERGRD